MSVLIVSLPGDAHALAVDWAIRAKDGDPHIIAWSDYPQKLHISYNVGSQTGTQLQIRDGGAELPSTFRTIWNHRTCRPEPPSTIDRADHEPIRQSAEWVLRGMAAHIERHAFAANPARSKWYFDNKLNQIDAAQKAGFTIPETLISNSPEEIEAFIRHTGGCVVKPLRFLQWDTGHSNVEVFTTPITSIASFDAEAVSSCPMIYQRQIRKALEYRVVVLGRQINCYEILSQDCPGSEDDWRMIRYLGLRLRPASLPGDLQDRVLAFMSYCGLVYGSLDFALTPEGEIVFFEVNETGQFLWIEEILPDEPLLDMFAEFLLAGDPHFIYRPQRKAVRFADWRVDGVKAVVASRQRHVTTHLDRRYADHVGDVASPMETA